MNLRPISLILPFIMFLSNGCVFLSNNKLPKRSATAREATLRDFAGTYRLAAEPRRNRGEDVRDSFGFLNGRERRTGDILRLELSIPVIKARYESGTNSAGTGVIDTSSPLVRLERGRLSYKHPVRRGTPVLPGIGFSAGKSTFMYFAERNDLVLVTESWEAAAPLLIFPFYESKRRVYRFERVAE
jgi:hypothetical protein